MSCDWKGNRRSGVALAMRHRLEWFINLRAEGLSKGDEHPTNTPHGYDTLYLFTRTCTAANIPKATQQGSTGMMRVPTGVQL